MVRKMMLGVFVLFLAVSFAIISWPSQAAEEKKDELTQYVGLLIYRTGPFAAGGSGTGPNDRGGST